MDALPLYARLGRAAGVPSKPKKRAAASDASAPDVLPQRKKTKAPSAPRAVVRGSAGEGPSSAAAPRAAKMVEPPALEDRVVSEPRPTEKRGSPSSDAEIEAEFFADEPSASLPDPSSSSSLPLPPPLPKPLLPRGRLWQDGVVPEVSAAFLPPAHFTSGAPLSQPALDELHRNQAELCRAIGFNQSFIVVRELYARSYANGQRLQAQVEELTKNLSAAEAKAASVGELKEELEVAEAKARSAAEELAKGWADRDAAVAALEGARGELAATRDAAKTAAAKADLELQRMAEECARAQKAVAEGVAASKVLQQQRNSLIEEKEKLQKALDAERLGREEAADALVDAAEECFEQALAQIRYFNPGVDLNVAGYDYRAFVTADGTLIPYTPPEAGEAAAEGSAPENPDRASDAPQAAEGAEPAV